MKGRVQVLINNTEYIKAQKGKPQKKKTVKATSAYNVAEITELTSPAEVASTDDQNQRDEQKRAQVIVEDIHENHASKVNASISQDHNQTKE